MTTEPNDEQLDQLLRSARDAVPVSATLEARVMADAAMVQATMRAAPAARGARTGLGWLAEIRGALGGWPGLSGVTLAGIAGLALGIFAPDLIDGLSGGQIGLWSGDLGTLPEIGLLWEEGGDV